MEEGIKLRPKWKTERNSASDNVSDKDAGVPSRSALERASARWGDVLWQQVNLSFANAVFLFCNKLESTGLFNVRDITSHIRHFLWSVSGNKVTSARKKKNPLSPHLRNYFNS